MAKTKKSFLLWFLPALLAYAVGFALTAVYDLSINQALYSPHSLYGILFEGFGWYPAFFPPLFMFVLLLTVPGPAGQKLWRRIVAGVAALAGLALIYDSSYGTLVLRGLLQSGADPLRWIWLAAGVVLAGLLLWASARLRGSLREKLFFWALCGTVLLAANEVLIRALKMLWNRCRFDEMLVLGSFEGFTPWYRPLGFGGSSFPSGHTASAACILMLLVLCDLFPKIKRWRPVVTALCWVYIAAMGLSRVVIGRHFLSDTLAGSALIALLFFALHHSKLYQKHLLRVLKSNPPQRKDNAQ